MPPRSKFYDLLTAAPLIAGYLFGLSQVLPLVMQQIALARLFIQTDYSVLPATLVLGIVSRLCTSIFFALLVIMFTVRRIPMRYPLGFYPRFAAVVGAFLGTGIVMLPPEELSSALYVASLVLIIGGISFAIWAMIALSRSISILPEARKLVTSGPYVFVRHPLYLGELVALFGIALQYTMPWALLMLGVQCFFQFERIRNEERVLLRAFPNYEDYMKHTARLIPRLY